MAENPSGRIGSAGGIADVGRKRRRLLAATTTRESASRRGGVTRMSLEMKEPLQPWGQHHRARTESGSRGDGALVVVTQS